MNGVASRFFSVLWDTVKIIYNVVSRPYKGADTTKAHATFQLNKMWLWRSVTFIENELNFYNAVEIIITP